LTIFFDLDGTLIDGKERLYRLFIDLTQNLKVSSEEYWQLKRAMFDHDWILSNLFNYSDIQLANFHETWLELIESEKYLKFNKLFDYTIPLLNKFKKYPLYIVTSRQLEQSVLDEISKMGILNYFRDILVTKKNQTKKELITERINTYPSDIIVGDTGIDILTGKNLNIRTVAVLSGFRGYEALINYHPDYIINNISELEKLVL
jgi:phosphoglycolate phosphatase